MHSRFVCPFLIEINQRFKETLQEGGVLNETVLNDMFSKYQHYEHVKLPRMIQYQGSPYPTLLFTLFYNHSNGRVFQVVGMITNRIEKPLYTCSIIDPDEIAKDFILIENVVSEPVLPRYYEE